MDDQTTPDEAREALHIVIDRVTDAGVLALWRFIQAWVAQHADETDEEC